MKNFLLILCLFLIASCKKEPDKTVDATPAEVKHHGSEPSEAEEKKSLSPHTSAMAMIGDAHIHIDYSSPGVRKRIIFGGLLPYDEVWQAGAHMATWIETNKDLLIDGNELKAGKYGFFIIPNQEEWTVIFNSNWNQHGKDDYSDKEDVLRFKVVPTVTEDIIEQLEFNVTKTDDRSGIIKMGWEKVTIQFPFQVK